MMVYIVTLQYDGDFESYIDSVWMDREDAVIRVLDLADDSDSTYPFEWYGDQYTNGYSWLAIKEMELK